MPSAWWWLPLGVGAVGAVLAAFSARRLRRSAAETRHLAARLRRS